MRKEKKSKSGTIVAFIIAFVMISSVIGFIYSGEREQFKYKGIKFIRTQDGWFATINNKRMTFDYFPSDTEQIELSQDIINALNNRPEIDTTSIINDTFSEEIALAQYNMALVLTNLNIYTRRGFTTNNTFNLPIITCEDATSTIPIIYFKQSNQTKISLDNNCITAEARNNIDVLRIKDRLLYSILGIFQIE